MLKYFLLFFVALVLSDRLTVYIGWLARRLGVVDTPSERRLHSGVVPRAGGLAVVIAFFATATFFSVFFEKEAIVGSLNHGWLISILPAAALLVVTGLVDDARGLSPLVKLCGQTAASLLIVFSGITLQSISIFELPFWLDLPLTVFFLLALINAFNLIDGLDGLAAGLAAIAAVGLIGLSALSGQPINTLMLLAFLGAIVGFLRHNFHPASIFLGDTGAMFLGFMIGVFALESSFKTSAVTALAIPLLAFGVPLIDTLLAIWRRSMRRILTGRGGMSEADMDHLHHRMVRLGLSHKKVAYILYLFGALLVGVGLTSVTFQSHALGIYLIAFSVCTYIVLQHLVHIELWDTGRVIVQGLPFPRHGFLTRALYPVLDILLLTLAFVAAYALSAQALDFGELRKTLLAGGVVWVGICFCAVALARTYARVWSQARISEYVYLVGSLLLGVFFAAGVQGLLDPNGVLSGVLFGVLFYGLSGALLSGLRALPRVVNDIMALSGNGDLASQADNYRILLAGANLSFLRQLKRKVGDLPYEATVTVVGFIDNNVNLRHRYIYGYRVLGTFEEAQEILKNNAVDEVIITEQLKESEIEYLQSLARENGLVLRRWTLVEEVLSGLEIVKEREEVTKPKVSRDPALVEARRGESLLGLK